MNSFTPEFFDTLIIVLIIIGLALAVVRLYADFSRALPPDFVGEIERAETRGNDDDTRPNPAVKPDDESS